MLASATIALVLSIAATGCRPAAPNVSWSLGRTHGVVIETGAARGGVSIYRSPRSVLMQVWQAAGINGVMAGIGSHARSPHFAICAYQVCFSANDVNNRIHGWVYGDPWDLKGALFDAQANYNCLSLTLISRGVYNKNWTMKSVGCALGSVGAAPADDPQAEPSGDGVELITAEGAPDFHGDRPAGSDAPMPGPPEPEGTGPVILP